MALLSVFVIESWPTTISKVAGRYFLAETIKFSINGYSCEGENVEIQI
jgi:hypothetical protein